MGFSRQEYWSGLPFSSPRDLPNPGIEPRSPALEAWFGLVGIYPVPLPGGHFSASLSCLYCSIWGGLSVFWLFVEFSLLWSFLTVGGAVWVACQGFLVREACVGVLVGEAGFLLSGVQ